MSTAKEARPAIGPISERAVVSRDGALGRLLERELANAMVSK